MKYIRLFEDFDTKFGEMLTKGLPKTSDKFWEFVDKVKWSENGDYTAGYIKNVASPYFSYSEFSEFSEIYDTLYVYLYEILKPKWLKDNDEYITHMSDDSFTDFLSSVIGFGEDYYAEAATNYLDSKISEEVYHNYKENFGYIFGILNYGTSMFTISEYRESWEKNYNRYN